MDNFRPLTIKAGDEQISEGHRIRVQGSKNMTLLPDFLVVEVYNLTDEDIASITHNKTLFVYGENGGLLCSAEIDALYTHQRGANMVTEISIVDGKTFWGTKISKSFGGGSSIKTVFQNIIQNAKIGPFTASDVKLIRGQTYTGRLAECVSMLAKSANGRAYITNGTVYVTSSGESAEVVKLNENEIILDQDTATGARIVKTTVKGYPIGALIELGNARYRLVSQKIDADNFEGPWDAYLILIKDSDFEMEGGL